MKKEVNFFLFCLPLFFWHCQNEEGSKKIELNYSDALNSQMYEEIKNYDLIMIGELHGTVQPVNFLTGLADLFSSKGDSTLIGFEIPGEFISKEDIQKGNVKSIIDNSFFFNSENEFGGRPSVSWYNAILKACEIEGAKVFFFDLSIKEMQIKDQNRDSLMYLKIKDQIKNNPGKKILTISGNIHNRLKPYKGISTMGWYLKNDPRINKRILSINHHWRKGFYYSSDRNGKLEVTELKQKNIALKKINPPEYFSFLNSEDSIYDAIIFSDSVKISNLFRK